MIRRFSALALAMALFISALLPVTAHASELVQYTELLEYDTVDSSGNMFYCSGSKSVSLECPTYGQLSYIDLTFRVNGSASVTAVSVKYSSTTFPLTLQQIETGYYRAYGSISGSYASVLLSFTTASAAYITLESVKVLGGSPTAYGCNADVSFTNHRGTSVYATSYNITTQPESVTSTSVSVPYDWQANIRVYDWHKFDTVVIWGSCTDGSIVSARASLGTTVPVPCTVSYFDASASGSYIDSDVGTTNVYGKYLYMIEVDLSSLDREDERELRLYMTGAYANYTGMTFNCQSVNGYVSAANTSSAGWWNRFTRFMQGLFGSDREQDGDDFATDMENQASDMEQAVQDMNEVTRPPVEDIEVSIDGYVDPVDMNAVGDVVGGLLGNDLVLSMVMISLILSLAAYVVFGKR